MIATYVKKDFSKKEWEYYGKIPGYQRIDNSPFGINETITAAFSMPTENGEAPFGYTPLNDEELRGYDNYCKGSHHYPQPFEEKENS